MFFFTGHDVSPWVMIAPAARETSVASGGRSNRVRASHSCPRTVLHLMATTLGIDIGGTSVKAAVYVDSKLVRTGQSSFYTRPTTQQLHSAVRAAVGGVTDFASVGLC